MHNHLTITGEFLTRTARDLMLSDEPGQAYRLIADGLIGEGADKIALQILDGEVNLTGDSSTGIGLEDADPADVAGYLKDRRYIYAGRVRLDGCWCRPRSIVTSYGPRDARAATKAGYPMIGPGRAAWGKCRAEYYAGSGNRVEWVSLPSREVTEAYVVFEPCGESPQWMKPPKDVQQAVDQALAAGRSLDEVGYGASPSSEARQIIEETDMDDDEADELRDLAYAAEDEAFAETCRTLGERVREQAGFDVFPMTLLDGRVVQVPRAPFTHWALHRLPDPGQLPAWDLVSPSGLKMALDNRHHTDWMLGAGLDLGESYKDNVNKPAWEAAAALQFAEVDDD